MCCQTETTPFVITYNPALPNLAHIIHKHSNLFHSSDRCRNIFKNLPLVAYRRRKNISDILVRAQLTNSTNTSNSRPTPGSFRCNNRNCTSCPYIEHGVINTLFILQVRPTTSNLISLVKLLMLSISFNVACVIYNILEKLNVASKTVLMNTDDQYSTLLVITSILQFQNQ